LKFPDIPHLPSYRHSPPQSFWECFPKNLNSDTISTPVNVDTFKNNVEMCIPEWTPMQIKIAEDAISNLTYGTTSKFKTLKNPTFSPNANSALNNGRFMTVNIALWIQKKFVVGPFERPPFQNFN
jgi:hypothetical protein